MKEIIKAIEHASEQINYIETVYSDVRTRPESMKRLIMSWREYRRGLIRACEYMGFRVTVTDLEGLRWTIEFEHVKPA